MIKGLTVLDIPSRIYARLKNEYMPEHLRKSATKDFRLLNEFYRWLEKHLEELLTDEEKAEIEAMIAPFGSIEAFRAEKLKSSFRERHSSSLVAQLQHFSLWDLPNECRAIPLRYALPVWKDERKAIADVEKDWISYLPEVGLLRVYEILEECGFAPEREESLINPHIPDPPETIPVPDKKPESLTWEMLPADLKAILEFRIGGFADDGLEFSDLFWDFLTKREKRRIVFWLYHKKAQEAQKRNELKTCNEKDGTDRRQTSSSDTGDSEAETDGSDNEILAETSARTETQVSVETKHERNYETMVVSYTNRHKKPTQKRIKPSKADLAALGKLSFEEQLSNQSRNFRIEPYISELSLRHRYELECAIWIIAKSGYGDRTKVSYRKFCEEVSKLVQTKAFPDERERKRSLRKARQIIERGNGIFWKALPEHNAILIFGVPRVLAALGRKDGRIPFVTELFEIEKSDIVLFYEQLALRGRRMKERKRLARAFLFSIAIQRLHGELQSMFDFSRRFKISRATLYRLKKEAIWTLARPIIAIRNYQVIAELEYDYGMFGYDENRTMREFGELFEKAINDGKVRCLWVADDKLLKTGFHFYKNLKGQRCLVRMLPNSYMFTFKKMIHSKVVLSAVWRRLKDAVRRIAIDEGWLDATGKITASAVAKMSATDRQWVLRAYNLGIVKLDLNAAYLLIGSLSATKETSKSKTASGRSKVASVATAIGRSYSARFAGTNSASQTGVSAHDSKASFKRWQAAVMGYKSAMRRRFGYAPPSLDSVVVSEPERGKVVVWAETACRTVPYGRRIELLNHGRIYEIMDELCGNSFEQYVPLGYLPLNFKKVLASGWSVGAAICRALDATTLKPTLPLEPNAKFRNTLTRLLDAEFRNALLSVTSRLKACGRLSPVLSFSYPIQSVVQLRTSLEHELLTELPFSPFRFDHSTILLTAPSGGERNFNRVVYSLKLDGPYSQLEAISLKVKEN